MAKREITIVPAPNCRRSRKVMDYLKERGIPISKEKQQWKRH